MMTKLILVLALFAGIASASYQASFNKHAEFNRKIHEAAKALGQGARRVGANARRMSLMQDMGGGDMTPCQSTMMSSLGAMMALSENEDYARLQAVMEGGGNPSDAQDAARGFCRSSAFSSLQSAISSIMDACSEEELAEADMLNLSGMMDMMCAQDNGVYCITIAGAMESQDYETSCAAQGCLRSMMQAMSPDDPAFVNAMVSMMCLESNGEFCLPFMENAESQNAAARCETSCYRDYINTMIAAVEANPTLCSSSPAADAPSSMPGGEPGNASNEIASEEGDMLDLFQLVCNPDDRVATVAVLEFMCLKDGDNYCMNVIESTMGSDGPAPPAGCGDPSLFCSATECSDECKTSLESYFGGSSCCIEALATAFAGINTASGMAAEIAPVLCGINLASDVCGLSVASSSQCVENPAWPGGASAGAGGDAGSAGIPGSDDQIDSGAMSLQVSVFALIASALAIVL